MVDGEQVIIDQKELDAFFSDVMPASNKRVYTPREQALIIEGYKRGANKEELSLKLKTSLKTMRRWYNWYCKENKQ